MCITQSLGGFLVFFTIDRPGCRPLIAPLQFRAVHFFFEINGRSLEVDELFLQSEVGFGEVGTDVAGDAFGGGYRGC
ncbi:hypothetical protein BDW59DRAFT_165650 [Aspergillus cavernicola]|uniref:Uncharacterized protein n=1 Tax=Aspergillus cavernicola TaxID=176166 RepID=A0ABR4HS51_9EURO